MSLSFFNYSEITLILLWYLLLVLGVDLLSSWLRRLVRFGEPPTSGARSRSRYVEERVW